MDAQDRIEAMKAYYAERMTRYDPAEGDAPPGWVSDGLRGMAEAALRGRQVLEVASGTGLWSQWLAPAVGSLLGVEYTETALALARAKEYPPDKVRLIQGDAYDLAASLRTAGAVGGGFDGGFHADWWSHIPKTKRGTFLASFHGVLQPGATVVMVDHLPWGAKREQVDEHGDRIQTRKGAGGALIEVVKNFPSEAELRADLADWGSDVEFSLWPDCGVKGHGRWAVRYTVKK